MAYASESLALAALELFVQAATQEEPEDLAAVQAELPVERDAGVKAAQEWMKRLPKDWGYHLDLSRQAGDAWTAALGSLAVLVPSVVVGVEWNVLINPQHPEISRIKVVQTIPFRFDQRMFRKTS